MKPIVDYTRAKTTFKKHLYLIESVPEPISHIGMIAIIESIKKTRNSLYALKTDSSFIDSLRKTSISRLKACLFSATGHAELKELDTNFIKNFIIKDFREINHYFSNP